MYRAFTCVSVICLLFCVPAAEGKKYAVLISAGVATTDDAAVNSCFWYNPYLQYVTLLDEGYEDDDIYFLYGYGTDFNSGHACYQPPYAVTDYPVSRANIQSVFNTLAGIMTSNDFLYVWWMGHGGPSGSNLVMSIDTTAESVYDYEFAAWVGQITDYDVRTFSWMTCYSGGILNDLEGARSIVMSSATFYESTYDEWLCDTYHAEFHYPERCAWAWETPCGICGSVDADSDDDSRVSFHETFTYAEANTASSHPQISDLGGLAPDTFLGGCTSQGQLELDQAKYACSSYAGIGVVDCDLNTDDEVIESVTVTIDSTTEPGGETVLLTETGPASADFRGTIELSTSDAPGVLHVSEGDVVTATYIDADDGQGGVNVVVTDTAVVDCTPPEISNVQTASVEPRSATVTFDTDEPTKGTVRFGFVCGALGAQATEAGFETDHTVNLSGLDDDSMYFYAVDAEDEAGNTASDDNGGVCYTFTTPDVPDYFTEEFGSGLDLEGLSLILMPIGSNDFYCGCVESITELPTDPPGGTTLSFSPSNDDGYANCPLSGGAQVALYGTTYGNFYVGTNGYITFGGGDSDYTESLADQFSMPRISGLFDDLNPSASGSVSWKQLADRAAVTWENVPEYSAIGSNTFQIEMYFNGTIVISYLSMDAGDGIAGLSEGNGLDPEFFNTDLSAMGDCGPPDCNGNGVPDQEDIAEGTSEDCNNSGVPDECEVPPIDPQGPDCNGNGIPDECETDCQPNGVPDDCDLAGGTSRDCNANSVPDECDVAGGTSQDCQPNDIPDECDIDPADPDGNGRVSQDLPPNGVPDECEFAPPVNPGPPDDVTKNRYVSFGSNNEGIRVAFQVEMTASVFFPESTGVLGWVGEPFEATGDPGVWIARVEDAAFYSNSWPSIVHAGDCKITPAAIYEVRAAVGSAPVIYSGPLAVPTAQHWGDVVGQFDGSAWSGPNGIVNMDDVFAAVQKFRNSPTAPPLTWVDLDEEVPNAVLNMGDIFQIVKGFKVEEYPFRDPGECPQP